MKCSFTKETWHVVLQSLASSFRYVGYVTEALPSRELDEVPEHYFGVHVDVHEVVWSVVLFISLRSMLPPDNVPTHVLSIFLGSGLLFFPRPWLYGHACYTSTSTQHKGLFHIFDRVVLRDVRRIRGLSKTGAFRAFTSAFLFSQSLLGSLRFTCHDQCVRCAWISWCWRHSGLHSVQCDQSRVRRLRSCTVPVDVAGFWSRARQEKLGGAVDSGGPSRKRILLGKILFLSWILCRGQIFLALALTAIYCW